MSASKLPVLDRAQAGDYLVRAELGDPDVTDDILRAIPRADASLSFRAMAVIAVRARARRTDPHMIVIRGVVQKES